jgi:hypothetical protein
LKTSPSNLMLPGLPVPALRELLDTFWRFAAQAHLSPPVSFRF